jgi:adenylosuccinate synthase
MFLVDLRPETGVSFLRAYVIIDLGFGDSGKGLLTDALVRHLGAGVVVRYNGGAQAAHNVITPEGQHHTFSQFGSGTFVPGVKTYLSRYIVIHPQALLIEGDILVQKGLRDVYERLRVSEQAPVITPFHQAANRIHETLRGANRHGSCGVGVGEVVEDLALHPEQTVFAGDLNHPALLRKKLHAIRDRKWEQIRKLCQDAPPEPLLASELGIFLHEEVIDSWLTSAARIGKLGMIAPDSVLEGWLHQAGHVIFEGAQGVLLDENLGFHPYTTWSRCTGTNATEIIKQMSPGQEVYRVGILRSYCVRHGPGPLPTETDELASAVHENNKYNQWQGPVRYGWFDAILARYALQATDPVDTLALTHLDVLPRLKSWKYCAAYELPKGLGSSAGLSGSLGERLTTLPLLDSFPLERRAEITQALFKVSPVLQTRGTEEETVIGEIESLLDRPVAVISRGPSANHVQILKPLFQNP